MSSEAIGKNEPTAHDRLREFRDRIVRLEEERKVLAEDIKDLYQEADSNGFAKAAMHKVVKRSMMDAVKRAKEQEVEEIADVYLANLGLLAGAPLNDAARQRADAARSKPTEDNPAETPKSNDEPNFGAPSDAPEPELEVPQETNEQARERGKSNAQAGLSVFKNPYVAGDPRRAYWDEGWCEEVGSDGMDIPDAWRRKSPPKKPEAK